MSRLFPPVRCFCLSVKMGQPLLRLSVYSAILGLRCVLYASTHLSVCCVSDPEWASYTLGVFVCHSCSGLHRNIAQISRVKSILLDPWSSCEAEVRTAVPYICNVCKEFINETAEQRWNPMFREDSHWLQYKTWLEVTSAASGLALI